MLDPFAEEIHSLSLLAAKDLMVYLREENEIIHDFGLKERGEEAKGKMFGVLVVQTVGGELGYLAAFSGKLGGSNSHARFVPPIYDSLAEDGFLSEGMIVLQNLGKSIKGCVDSIEREKLVATRAKTSAKLQSRLFDEYIFLNRKGERKGLREIFNQDLGKNPPTAAGECAAPKLLQYAFDNSLRPIALAEFWWGASTRSAEMKHKQFYPPCEDKCRPILNHMLS